MAEPAGRGRRGAAPAADIVIATPALAAANNGNWRTAQRWARFLSGTFRVRITDHWSGGSEALMIALHARRSADAACAWRDTRGSRPLMVVLTGTDLYRDIAVDARARQTLERADRLVVLNELGAQALPPALRHKVVVCLQSSAARAPLPKPARHLRALMVGHLRHEKAPDTWFAAARLLAARHDIVLDHIGGALEPALGAQALALQAELPGYRWLGPLPHGQTRRRIQAAGVLVHASRMEGGAQAVIEAVVSGTPVIASRIDGNVGLLGAEHPGWFEVGDAAALAALLVRARDDPAFLQALAAAGARRAPLFDPAHERQTLLDAVRSLLGR
ncbi:selenoneine biosynthesis selenosugar synthase SenB [Rubrivivax sp. RP6-9]|uniref:selenoneine biosynthesis selenosugar synthase SenB n=1 Tax=Rubrivivax sp. RP6-9 TaxID=3415750 RepID=UPI003CC5FD3C